MKRQKGYRVQSSFNYKDLERLDKKLFPSDERHVFFSTYNWELRHEGRTVGFACLKPLLFENYVFLERAGVIKAHQGKGLHKRLIKKRVEFAKEYGFEGVISYTKKDNVKSANNLIALGFKLYNPTFEWADSDCIYFILEF